MRRTLQGIILIAEAVSWTFAGRVGNQQKCREAITNSAERERQMRF